VAVSASLPRRDEPLPLTTTVRAGAVLTRQGEACEMAWLVRSGALWESILLRDGRELAVAVLGEGDVVGEPAGVAAATTVRALRVCRLLPIDPRNAADRYAARARHAAALAAELAWSDVPTRLRRRLQELAARFGRPAPGGTAIELRLTQDRLALLCGSTRETVNRALRLLVASGEVRATGIGRYVIVDGPVVPTLVSG
jgi:CRP-like cAMP-binding protein